MRRSAIERANQNAYFHSRLFCEMHDFHGNDKCTHLRTVNSNAFQTETSKMADRDPEREENQNDLVEKTEKFLRDGCGCSHGAKGGPCSKELQEETVLFNLNNCLELTTAELDLVVLANIQAFTRSETIGTKRNRRPRSNFQFQSSCICTEMFLHLYGLSYSQFRHLKEHYKQHGVFPRTHGNSKMVSSRTLMETARNFPETHIPMQ